jgi:low affinity Fe/Cu permease
MPMHKLFSAFAKHIADWTGRPVAFILGLTVVMVWAVTGPLFDYSETWQLVINTGTTIITFLMVFLIQNAQNRDTHALQIKLDELLRVTEGAHSALLDLEELDDRDICEIRDLYQKIAAESRKIMDEGGEDTHIPAIDYPHGKKVEPKKKRRRKPRA